MSLGWVKMTAVAAMAAFGLCALDAHAADTSAWLQDRQARFAAFKAAHPHPGAVVAKIKAKTADLIADAAAEPDLQAALDQPPIIWNASAKPVELWDGADLPEMVVVPAGEYTLGSPDSEPGRDASESPRRRVRIGYSFAVSKTHITLGEYERFVAETHHESGNKCVTQEGGEQPHPDRNYLNTSFAQTLNDPVVCMNLDDVQAYLAWISKKTGHAYRLLTDSEYEYAARAGSTTPWWWGSDPNATCLYANGADLDTKARFPQYKAPACHDGYVFTSPAGLFKPNAFGLYDMVGQAWSLTADCWNDTYANEPTDGSANMGGDCGRRSMRGASWDNDPASLRSARRSKNGLIERRGDGVGFRVAITL
jgi:formylglycine-generating enzyme required for sulfatase activity